MSEYENPSRLQSHPEIFNKGHRWIGAARKGLVLRLTGFSHRPGPPGANSAVWEMIVP
jgi:hypothetical protein